MRVGVVNEGVPIQKMEEEFNKDIHLIFLARLMPIASVSFLMGRAAQHYRRR